MNPYYEDEWYEDECDYCGSHYDADGWCPFCDYEHYDGLDSWDEEGEDETDIDGLVYYANELYERYCALDELYHDVIYKPAYTMHVDERGVGFMPLPF